MMQDAVCFDKIKLISQYMIYAYFLVIVGRSHAC